MILQKVDVPIFPNRTQCEVEITKALREVTKRPTLRPTKLTPGELCAGGEPKEFCTNFGFAYTLGLLILSLYLKEELTYCADMHLQPNLKLCILHRIKDQNKKV